MEGLLLPLLLLVLALPLFLSVRRQKKQVQEQQELQNSLEVGDLVMTSSGLYGTVVDLDDEDTLELEISEGFVTTWLRQAVSKKINPVDESESDSDEEETPEDDEAEVTEPAANLDDADEKDERERSTEVASSAESSSKQ